MKVFVASFNRASLGALSLLFEKLKANKMYTSNYKEADYILACGDRIENFDFTLERFRENQKIIHLWAGEISQGTHDEVYRHAMTLMSDIQLCTNEEAKRRVIKLCQATDKKPKVYVVGNIMLDNLMVKEGKLPLPKQTYDIILYNPATRLTNNGIRKEIKQILSVIDKPFFWIEPNGDKGSELLKNYVNTPTLPRPKFLGLLKNCKRLITNSSSIYYEAQFLLKPRQIIQIGVRNRSRESKFANMKIKNASDNVIKILKKLEISESKTK